MYGASEEDRMQCILDQLMASKRVVNTSIGPIWFEFPTADDRIFARHIYDSAKERCEKDGIPSVDEARAEHLELGLWDMTKERSMQQLPEFIGQLGDKLKVEKNLVRKRKLKSALLRQIDLLNGLRTAFEQLMGLTSEFIAYNESLAYFVWRCFFDISGNKLWNQFSDILAEGNLKLIQELSFIYGNQLEEKDIGLIRKLARDVQWRIRWKASNGNSLELFGRPSKDLTMSQFMLVYWSQMYDSVYEAHERPPAKIIENDDELDKWLIKRGEEDEREISQRFEGKSSLGIKNSKIDSAPEVFRVVTGYYNDKGEYVLHTDDDRMDLVEDIKNLNSPTTRAFQRKGEEDLRQTPGTFIPEEKIRKSEQAIKATGGTLEVRRK